MLKKHEFWACVVVFAMTMTVITGYDMVKGHSKKD